MNTVLLDTAAWDLVLDASGNIAMAANPYAVAQDVASAIKTFAGEIYYDARQGIPYLENIFGQRPALAFITAAVEKAALTVPEVVSARCLIASFKGRTLSGQVQIIDKTGASNNVHF